MNNRVDWIIEPAEALAEQRAQWDQLNQADTQLPLLDAQFWEIALRWFGTGKESLAWARVSGKIVAAGLFSPAQRLARNLFQPSQAPLGPWLLNQSQAIPEAELLQTLRQSFGKGCAAIGITQQDPLFRGPMPAQPALLKTPHITTPALTVTGSFKDFWEKRGKNLRKNMRRQRNRLERDGITTRLATVTDPGELALAVDRYAHLEQTGWKLGTGTAVTAEGDQGGFYRDLLSHYGTRGEARVYQYYFNAELVASDLCVRRNGTLIILKTAYDASIQNLSPGILMKEEVFQRLFEDSELKRVEFYGRVMERHLQWTSDVRDMYHLTYMTPLGRALRSARQLLTRGKATNDNSDAASTADE